ncbi:hypothetical protein [Mesorhizobium sp. 10J20-29]
MKARLVQRLKARHLEEVVRHIAHMRYRMLAGRSGARELRFGGSVELDHAEQMLTPEARRWRHFRNWVHPKDASR